MQLTIKYSGKTYAGFTESEALSAGIPQSVVNEAIASASLNVATEQRRKAYLVESDPLYMEWQYDQTPEKEQAWRDKVAEIKARYPLPSES
ncbi:TPA: hypothetical protein JG810_004519 [Vibrio parahaemolyticus]|nr:hypothetical protein [Vibrio parahaemolyticus]